MANEFNILLSLYKQLTPNKQKLFTEKIASQLPTEKNTFTLNKLIENKDKTQGILCPHCQSVHVVKNGTQLDKQRYKCKNCNKTFTSISNTFLARTRKDFKTWKKFIQCMIEGFSVRMSATKCKVNRNTAFIWRHKILDTLTEYVTNQKIMKGVIEADDTFFRLSFKGNKPINRDAYHRGSLAKKRGMSKEQVCVSCAVSRNNTKVVYSKITTLGRAKAKDLQKVFKGRFSDNSILCTDKDKAYRNFAQRECLEHIQMQSGTASRVDVYHIQNINGYHSRLKNFIRRFKGVSTKYLNNYLTWNNIIRERKYNKITLLKMCIKVINNVRWSMIKNRPLIPV